MITKLEEKGVPVRERLRISPSCPLILSYHVALDQANESRLADAKVGTTGRGIGPRPGAVSCRPREQSSTRACRRP